MRIGLLSDVHGNLAGLRAVAEALRAEGDLDHIVVAGDHLWGGPRPGEAWAMLRATGWVLVRGNHDEMLAAEHLDRVVYDQGRYRRAHRAVHAWTRAALDAATLRDLGALPLTHRLTTPAGDLLVVHASPRSVEDRSGGPHNTAAEVEAAYAGTGAAAIAFGHYHRSFVRPTTFALLINVASVGLPLDGRPLAAYTILTAAASGWVVEQRHVAYEQAEEEATARAVGMPVWAPDA